MAQETSTPYRAGLYLGALQLLLTLGWTVYTIFLARLAGQVGIAAAAVIWLLILDQAVFMVTDAATGAAADRLSGRVGRVSRAVAGAAALSCAAFVALPWVAGTGTAALPLFLGLILLWVATSSALRAPTMAMLGRYVPRPQVPWLSGLVALGFGAAGAVAPYLGVALRHVDPRWPFALSSAALLLACLGLAQVERELAMRSARTEPDPEPAAAAPSRSQLTLFAAAAMVLGLGFQVHANVNSGPLFLHFAKPADLEFLLPVFWIGFSLAALPAGRLAARWGPLAAGGGAGLVAASAALAAASAGSLEILIAAQLVAGGAWGCLMTGALAAAPLLGRRGREGLALGLMFSAFALATLARMAAVAGGLPADPAYAAVLAWVPALSWSAGGAVLLVLAAAMRPGRALAAAS